MNIINRLLKIMLKFWDRFVLGFGGTLLESIMTGLSLGVLGQIVDICSKVSSMKMAHQAVSYTINLHLGNWTFINHLANGGREIFQLILIMVVVALGLTVIKGFCQYGKSYGNSSLVHKSLMAFRNLVYERIVRMDVAYFDANRTGDLTAKITNDVDNLRVALTNMLSVITDGVQGIVFITALFFINWQLSLFALLIFPPTILLVRKFARPIRKANTQVVENLSRMIIFLQETLQGIRLVKIFTKEDEEQKKFQGLTKDNYSSNMKGERLSAYQKPLNDLFSTVGFLVVVLILAQQILFGKQTLGWVVVYIGILNMAYKPLKSMAGFNDSLQRILASSTRLFGLVDLKDETTDDTGRSLSGPVKGNIEFRNVSFEYHKGHSTLQNVSCSVSAGKTLAIVGPSGSGKTTMVSLIPLFYRNFTGEILLDSTPIREIRLSDLRQNIAVVPQDTILFSGNIRDNIHYGSMTSSEEDIISAAKNANAHDFITKLKDGYNTEIGERGVKLSGGEKQRISIARALLKNPRILILDEATSALDTQSELLVQQALSFLMQNRTTFVIAHRLSTIRKADQIIVLDGGKLVEEGTHEELYKRDGLYRKLCKIQFEMNE
jgi:ATP-binding cassette, subfamily B, bacterial MsbA